MKVKHLLLFVLLGTALSVIAAKENRFVIVKSAQIQSAALVTYHSLL